MDQSIHVAAKARRVIESLDAGLREELLEHAASLAESPLTSLRRSRPPAEPAGVWAYDYESSIVDRLRFVLFLDGLDNDPPKLMLLNIFHSISEPE